MIVTRLDEVRDPSTGVWTHKMCCICCEFVPLDELWIDCQGQKWDLFKPCGDREHAQGALP